MTKSMLTKIVLGTMLFTWLPQVASAVPNPNGIAWTSSPSGFVASLYLSVLGRPKEPGPTGWEGNVTGNPSSRLQLFWTFVRTPEYVSKYGSSGGTYSVYWRSAGAHRTEYAVAQRQPGNFNGKMAGPYSFGVASAVRNYYQTYASRR